MYRIFLYLASLDGRLRRKRFFWTSLLVTFLFCSSFLLIESVFLYKATLILYPPFLWIGFSLLVRRLHDSGKSSWRLLWVIIPVLGPLLIALWVLWSNGSDGENQYGEDPRLVEADYLKVEIAS